MFSTDNLVLNTFRILEIQSIVTGGRISWVLPWRANYSGSYLFQFGMEPVDFGARWRLECEMMERPWFPSIDRLGGETASR